MRGSMYLLTATGKVIGISFDHWKNLCLLSGVVYSVWMEERVEYHDKAGSISIS